jgi:hypothetical protein
LKVSKTYLTIISIINLRIIYDVLLLFKKFCIGLNIFAAKLEALVGFSFIDRILTARPLYGFIIN